MLCRYGRHCHPLRPNARKAALEWLNSTKVLDTLSRWPEVDREDASLTAGAVSLLSKAVSDWPENENPRSLASVARWKTVWRVLAG
ncbi:Uncharacterized protein ImpA [Enterobacter hormaechei]|nr:Uncharacterized protein ImpA [Enterobacter hormaechei]